jgi:hypothetical protein
MTIQKNDLSRYRSYNYRWTFGPLSPDELNNPDLYRTSGGNLPIIRSSGLPDKPVKTAIESSLGINLEYFIDDVNIESLVSPNPGTGVTTVLTFEFTVTEPYSVGLFFQSLFVAADAAGYKNYIEAPFLLSLDFIGWDSDNTVQKVISKRCFAIKLTNVTFKVDSGGTIYNISAIAHNHVARTDELARLKKNTSIKGTTVIEMLSSSENSLANELNRREIITGVGAAGAEARATATRQPVGDRYIISFPNEGTSVSALPTGATFTSDINELGNSYIIENLNDFATDNVANEEDMVDESIIRRAGITIDSSQKVYTFEEGTKIEEIIKEVILSSAWGKNLTQSLVQPDSRGMVNWFRIDNKFKILTLADEEITGRAAYEIEYIVIPYKVHFSKFNTTNTPFNYASNIGDCVKSYYYSYTGKNTEILDFEFSIDNAYYNASFNTEAGQDAYMANIIAETNKTPPVTPPVSVELSTWIPGNLQRRSEHITKGIMQSGGLGNYDRKNIIARAFNDLILNSSTDNVSLNLKILGDPYYLSDNDSGNYRSGQDSIYLNEDGTVDYLRSEVDVLLQIKSGIDYNKNTNLMTLDPANGFNGIYKVITVTSNFSKGQFTQELSLLRRPNQTTESVDTSNMVCSAAVSAVNLEAAEFALNQSIQTVNQIIQPYLQILPEEYQSFDLDLMRVELFESLSSSSIFQAVESANNFINSFQLIQNNFISTIQGIAAPVNQLQTGVQELQNSINLIKNGGFPGIISGLSAFSANIGSIATSINQISSSVKSLPNTIQSSIKGFKLF